MSENKMDLRRNDNSDDDSVEIIENPKDDVSYQF